MPQNQKSKPRRNQYQCAIEVNKNGKYCVRLQVLYARRDWRLSVYFLASSFDRAIKKLDQTLQLLQRDEERLWFWGVDRTDDPHLAEELLGEMGLRRDRRADFPRKCAVLSVPPERPVPAFQLAGVRRALAEAVAGTRAAVASD